MTSQISSSLIDQPMTPIEEEILLYHGISDQERERRQRGLQRLKERLSHSPLFVEKAKKSGEGYWADLYSSQIMT